MRARLLAVSLGWVGISRAGDGVLAVLLPHQTLAAGSSDATTLGITTLVAIAVGASVQPFAGRASDRIGRWPVIVIGLAIASAGIGLLTIYAVAAPGAVVTLAGLSVAQAGHQPLVADRIGRQSRGRAAGLKGALDIGGAFFGFLVLARLLGSGEAVTAGLVLAAGLIIPFVAAFALLGLGPPPAAEPEDSIAAGTPGHEGANALLTLIGARFLFLLGIYVVGRFLVLWFADRSGLTPDAAAEQAGGVLAGLAMMTVLASVPSGWLADLFGRRGLMLTGGVLAAVGIGLLPMSNSVELVVPAGALMAIGTAAFGAGSWATLTDLAPPPDAGRLLGVANLGTAAAAGAAGIFGLLIDAGNQAQSGKGYAVAFVLSAASALAGGVVAWRIRPSRIAMPYGLPREVVH
jgi:MFS family permease